MTSAWQKYKEKNGVTILDVFNPNIGRASEELSNNRLTICQGCPKYINLTSQCKECGCFMKLKATYEAAKCPIDKW